MMTWGSLRSSDSCMLDEDVSARIRVVCCLHGGRAGQLTNYQLGSICIVVG